MRDFYELFFNEDFIFRHIIFGCILSFLSASTLFIYDFCFPERKEEEYTEIDFETIILPCKQHRRRRQKVDWRKEGF